MWLAELVKQKELEAQKNFENLKQDYNIIDYFPNETKWEKSNSWFGATLLEKDWTKYLAIRWTEWLSDWKDLYADAKMIFWKIPNAQAKEMMAFIDRTIKKDEKFVIVGHSLWWALSQIWTTIYKEQIDETYTFNSPWAKNLKVSDEDLSKFAKFRDFVHNKDSKEVWDLITNVAWTDWISPIANLWEDIWSYTIELKWLASHSISDMREYIETTNEKIVRQKIDKDKKTLPFK
jgi:hypothetical protein